MNTYHVYDEECNYVGSFHVKGAVRAAQWARVLLTYPTACYCVGA